MKSQIEHPEHYTRREHECIDEMIAVFGLDSVINFCACNAWKYRYRAGFKSKDGKWNEDAYNEDMAKSDWYVSEIMRLKRSEMNESKVSEKDRQKMFTKFVSDYLHSIESDYNTAECDKKETPQRLLIVDSNLFCQCGHSLCSYSDKKALKGEGFSYCPYCGQKIDWDSDPEDDNW